MTTIRLKSERHALEEIKRRVAQGQRRGASVSEVQSLLIEIDVIADALLEQLAEGIHKNPKDRPFRFAVMALDRRTGEPTKVHGTVSTREPAITLAKDALRFSGGMVGVVDTSTGRVIWSEKYPK